MTCFAKLPNRGMADLVGEVLGGAAGALAQGLGSFPARRDHFPEYASQDSSKISQGLGQEASSPLALRTN